MKSPATDKFVGDELRDFQMGMPNEVVAHLGSAQRSSSVDVAKCASVPAIAFR